MSLIKCHECSEEVSSKAKSCPKCGVKPKKKTSAATWIIISFVGAMAYATTQTEPSATKVSAPKAGTTKQSEQVNYDLPGWTTSYSVDEMTGKRSAYAASQETQATSIMSFPYADTRTWMGVGCDSKSEWVYLGFTAAPNLSDTIIEDGNNRIHTRVRWDDSLEPLQLMQKWGAKFLHFSKDKEAIDKIIKSKAALVELNWHSNGLTRFKYSMRGSSKALSEIRAACKKMK
jgi:hypothetical protein